MPSITNSRKRHDYDDNEENDIIEFIQSPRSLKMNRQHFHAVPNMNNNLHQVVQIEHKIGQINGQYEYAQEAAQFMKLGDGLCAEAQANTRYHGGSRIQHSPNNNNNNRIHVHQGYCNNTSMCD